MFDDAVNDIAVLLKFTVETGRLHGQGQEPWSVLSESTDPVDLFVCKYCGKGGQVKFGAFVATVKEQISYKSKKDK